MVGNGNGSGAQGEAMELDKGDEPESDMIDNEAGLAAQGEAMELDEGDRSDLDYDDYGYFRIQQEVEGEDFDEDGDGDRDSEYGEGIEVIKGEGGDEIDDELGAEDNEDSDEELEGFRCHRYSSSAYVQQQVTQSYTILIGPASPLLDNLCTFMYNFTFKISPPQLTYMP
ncbi:hypothetical protein EDB19DRAFT_1834600 [Suillus lakei]|nr:hypothetical protein EDB19DRAFT_1834600 [Suillus lakei]